jgi:ribosomal peptide maturation radical SAM protein 1
MARLSRVAKGRLNPADRGAGESVARLVRASTAAESDLVLVVPPFASPDRPSLGLHVIANVAQAAGLRVTVLYGNLAFSRMIGPILYRRLCHTPTEYLLGERLFARACHGPEFAGFAPERWPQLEGETTPDYEKIQLMAVDWVNAMANALASLSARLIGVSTVFEQTLASLALISAIKRRAPDKITLLGGANADGDMGPALAALWPDIDHIFVGEAEDGFGRFLASHLQGLAAPRLIAGEINARLDDLPPPRYGDFFTQLAATAPEGATCADALDLSQIRLPYESSRGCWWGEKHHCTFCGLNANGMTHRIKSAPKVAAEITDLAHTHGIDRILMVDNIMPHSYFSTLLPQLAAAENRLSLFYEQKANLTLDRMGKLKAAGIDSIQPGIESLSTALLRRMRKGSTARVNIDCLRHARSAGVSVVWNLLCDFPGDQEDDYEDMIRLIPFLHHLQPPGGVGGLSIDRFSPYHNDPAAFEIQALHPLAAYEDVFPGANTAALAYHFTGEYDSAIRRTPALHARLTEAVAEWERGWKADPPPLFCLFALDEGRRLLVDTRGPAGTQTRLVESEEARVLLQGSATLSPVVVDLLDQGQLAQVDGTFASLACAPYPSSLWDDL